MLEQKLRQKRVRINGNHRYLQMKVKVKRKLGAHLAIPAIRKVPIEIKEGILLVTTTTGTPPQQDMNKAVTVKTVLHLEKDMHQILVNTVVQQEINLMTTEEKSRNTPIRTI